MPSKPFEDDIWADPERVLAPTKEDLIACALEKFAEERECVCWADEALQACLDFHPEQSVFSRKLFTRTRAEVNQYLSVLDKLMIHGVDELRTAGRECSKDLFTDPRTEVKAIIAVDLALESFNEPLDLSDRPPEVQQHLPISQHLELVMRCYEYTIDRIEKLLSRFTIPKDELVRGYSTKKLQQILRAARKELIVCSKAAEKQRETELDILDKFPPPPSPDWDRNAFPHHRDPHFYDFLFGRAPVGNLPIRETIPPAAKRPPSAVPKRG